MKHKNNLWEQSLLTFAVFGLVGGFLESYTYILHGNVFCNAQTGNIVLMVIYFFKNMPFAALKYIFSILAYTAGILLSAIIPKRIGKWSRSSFMTLLEIAVLAALALIPETASHYYARTVVAFLCAVQYNTFTHCHGAAMSTTFCTNNLRQMILYLYAGVKNRDKASAKKAGIYAFLIAFFIVGAAVGAVSANVLGNYCVLVCTAPLIPLFFLMIAEDYRKEKDGEQKQSEII